MMRPNTGIRCVLLLIIPMMFLTGCATDKQIIAQAADVHGSLKPAVMEDEVLANYIQEVGDRVIEQAAKFSAQGKGPKKHFEGDNKWMFSPNMRFHFVNSKTVNAFTTGGEHMYIYTALLQQCTSEDELAAVVAHEYAHVYGRHVQKGTDRQYGLLIGGAAVGAAAGYAAGGDDNRWQAAGIGAGLGAAGGQFLNMGFTREDETEADKYGFRFYTRAGWDPEKFGDFFQKMIDNGYDKTPEIVSSHPSLKNRVKQSQEWAAELPREAADWRREPVASPRRFKELQERAAKLGKNAPSDTTLENSQKLLQALPRSCVSPIEQFADQKQAQEDLVKSAQKKSK